MAPSDNVSGRPSASFAAKSAVPGVPTKISSSDVRRQVRIVARTSPEVFTSDTARHHANAPAAPLSEHQAITGFSEWINSVFDHIALERDSYAHSFRSYSLKDASEAISRQRFAATAPKIDVPAVPTNFSDGKLQAFSVNHIVARTSPDVFSSGKPGRHANARDTALPKHEALPGFSELINPEFARSDHLNPASANGSQRRDITLGRSDHAHRPEVLSVYQIALLTSPDTVTKGKARGHLNARDAPPAEHPVAHQVARRPPRLGLTTDHVTNVAFAVMRLRCMAELRRIESKVDSLRDMRAKRNNLICKKRTDPRKGPGAPPDSR